MPPLYTQTTFKPVNPFTEEQPVRPGFKCNLTTCPNTTSLSVCARCKVAAYCSKSCQKADWGLHKYVLILVYIPYPWDEHSLGLLLYILFSSINLTKYVDRSLDTL